MIAMLYVSLEPGPMKLSLLREGDWAGIITMAIGLAALQTVLEEGNKDDWFGSPFIVRLSIIAAIALPLFVVIELTAQEAAAQSAHPAPPQFRLRRARELPARRRALRLGLSSCRSICRASRATTPSRSAWCWHGPGCRSSVDPAGAAAAEALRSAHHDRRRLCAVRRRPTS